MGNNTYSVAALAAALNVPRTTVNDWLAKYESFIDVVAVGKRKVYSERTLAVLQEVARLRDQGKSGAEIESALEQSMGVTPEVAPEKSVEEKAAPVAEKDDGQPEENTQTQLPAVKKFEENAMELAAFIAELRKEQIQSRKRSRLTAFMLLLVIIVLIMALGAAVQAVRMQFAERQLEAINNRKMLEKLNKDFASELKMQEKLRQQERSAAERDRAVLKNELTKLQKDHERSVRLWQQERERSERREEMLRKDRERREQAWKRREEMWQKEREVREKREQFLQKDRERREQIFNQHQKYLQQELDMTRQSLRNLTEKLTPPKSDTPVAESPAGAAEK